jgi:hypothetical protein
MAFIQFNGVTHHDPSRVDESYVLYTAADGVTRLIDLDGVVRNEWSVCRPAGHDGRESTQIAVSRLADKESRRFHSSPRAD